MSKEAVVKLSFDCIYFNINLFLLNYAHIKKSQE